MNRTWFAYVLAAALLAAPVAGVAQEATPRSESARQWGRVSFVDRLVQHQSELGLTNQQITQLRSIGESLQAANAPYLAQLQQARAAQGGERSSARGERARELVRPGARGGERPQTGNRSRGR